MKKFECHCGLHIIDVDIKPIEGIPYIGLTIYEHRSGQTGKLYKKPKQQGTVTLIGKEAERFRDLINRVKNEKPKDMHYGKKSIKKGGKNDGNYR